MKFMGAVKADPIPEILPAVGAKVGSDLTVGIKWDPGVPSIRTLITMLSKTYNSVRIVVRTLNIVLGLMKNINHSLLISSKDKFCTRQVD